MKTLLLLASLFTFAGQRDARSQQPSVSLENIQAEYRLLSEIKPVLVNYGDVSIYLLQKECGETQLTLIQGEIRVWGYSKTCPDFSPLEIKPGERYELPGPIMRLEADEDQFREDRNGPPGKYIISISYSLSPSYVAGKPELGRALSRKFSIVR